MFFLIVSISNYILSLCNSNWSNFDNNNWCSPCDSNWCLINRYKKKKKNWCLINHCKVGIELLTFIMVTDILSTKLYSNWQIKNVVVSSHYPF